MTDKIEAKKEQCTSGEESQEGEKRERVSDNGRGGKGDDSLPQQVNNQLNSWHFPITCSEPKLVVSYHTAKEYTVLTDLKHMFLSR